MKKALKWLGVLLGALIGLILVAAVVVYVVTEARFNKTYDIQPQSVAIPNDPAAVEYGKHVATIRGCVECHGPNLAGKVFLEDPAIGRIVASNLTAGKNGVGRVYADADWVRAIRHGVGGDGKPLFFMPSHELYYLSDRDLGAVIAFVRSAPPVDTDLPATQIAFPFRIMTLAGQAPPLSAEVIDHDAPRPPAPEPGVTAAYGQYLAVTCTGCHGEGLSGGPIPGMPPDFPPAPNITPAGRVSQWSEADFFTAMRTGVTPDGGQLRRQFMPWHILGKMTDDELKALWLHLQAIPGKEYGNR